MSDKLLLLSTWLNLHLLYVYWYSLRMKKVKCLLPVLIDRYNSESFMSGGERLTQSSLSEKTGIAASTISRMYNGTAQRYDSLVLARLCTFFGCDVGDLLALVDTEKVAA